jgi:hypothetical protein
VRCVPSPSKSAIAAVATCWTASDRVMRCGVLDDAVDVMT